MNKVFSIEDFDKAASGDYVVFICENCNEEVKIQKRKFTIKLCRKCKLKKKAEEGSYKNCVEKRKKTCIEKYGVDHPQKSEEVQNKTKQTCLERYGHEYSFQSEEVKDKIKDGWLKRFGVPYVVLSDESIKKRINTLHERYGDRLEKIVEKTKKTMLELYGVEHAMMCDDVKVKHVRKNSKFIYDKCSFDSSKELYYFIWAQEHGLNIERNDKDYFKYSCNGKEHICFPDFKMNNEYIEIKGEQFLNEDGIWRCPYDTSLDDEYEAKRQCFISNNVKIIYDVSEQQKYVEDNYGKDFINLCRVETMKDFFEKNKDFPYPTKLTDNYDSIIQYFHKSIWHAHKKGLKSPFEGWNDFQIMSRVYGNRLRHKKEISCSILRNGLSVTSLATKVSVFKPSLAKDLILKYLNEYEEIFDPFSGFSGRLLGAHQCGKKYIGQDLNQDHVNESNQIIEHLNCNAVISQKDIFESTGTYQCLFTCPPYSDKEIWGNETKFLSCDNWIDECLKRFSCKKYLFVVDETEKYKDCIVEVLENKSHLSTNNEYVVLIST